MKLNGERLTAAETARSRRTGVRTPGFKKRRRMAMFSHNANHKYYDTAGVPELLEKCGGLFKPEETILSSLRQQIKQEPILEIGVGAGRVTPSLLAISKDYIGIDYAEEMVRYCSQKVGEASLRVCDARNMSAFKDEQFAAVFFFWNGIDSVNPSDRILILKEVNRVLKKNGVFVFSAHNLDWWKHRSLTSFSRFSFARNPIALIKDNIGPIQVYAAGLINQLRTRMLDTGHAVILEYEEFMVLPIYYITREAQEQQLLDAGFCQVEAIGLDGGTSDGESRIRDYLLHYVARKK
jgi:SAM-dependent methyltransferase